MQERSRWFDPTRSDERKQETPRQREQQLRRNYSGLDKIAKSSSNNPHRSKPLRTTTPPAPTHKRQQPEAQTKSKLAEDTRANSEFLSHRARVARPTMLGTACRTTRFHGAQEPATRVCRNAGSRYLSDSRSGRADQGWQLSRSRCPIT